MNVNPRKRKVMITIDGSVRAQAKELFPLVPFSSLVEHLVKKEIRSRLRDGKDGVGP